MGSLALHVWSSRRVEIDSYTEWQGPCSWCVTHLHACMPPHTHTQPLQVVVCVVDVRQLTEHSCLVADLQRHI